MKNIFLSTAGMVAFVLFSFLVKPSTTLEIRSKTVGTAGDTARVELETSSFNDMSLLFIRDTADTNDALKDVFGKDYAELMGFIQQNNLQPMKFMAWYYSTQPPWIMDVAVQTNSLPAQLNGRVQSRIQQGGEVLIAHVWGPYDEIGQAYIKIQNWLKENNRKARSSPFEVYLNDPSSVTPDEIRTDVYQPIE